MEPVWSGYIGAGGCWEGSVGYWPMTGVTATLSVSVEEMALKGGGGVVAVAVNGEPGTEAEESAGDNVGDNATEEGG